MQMTNTLSCCVPSPNSKPLKSAKLSSFGTARPIESFIPLADQLLPEHYNVNQHNLSQLEMHKIINKSSKFNFLHCQKFTLS